ncbi:hypothetical protein SBOR_6089 [Sclerotinia borealis F-4128]|uniref:Zn(2)-C6 fungal-type domain-containing protein n=1 Tax=Sclerotinia borealis (strain F-4128) TaxID=1432307 RepID=W9C9V7_SCLBF|nr:hypothetical protein SBOR_6089 [Sclerotinia borealis F-4128]
METKPQKRRRIVKTCWECYRRKQKCNRGQPCDVCISRNVPEKCSYSSSTPLDDLKDSRHVGGPLTARTRDEEIILKSGSTPSDLFGQVGYGPYNNSFSGLQKSFHINDELSTFVGSSSSSSLSHPGLRHKFLSLVIQLPSQSIISELIESFLLEVHWYFKILEEQYFITLLKSWQDIRNTLSGQSDLGSISRDLQYFPALLFQVLAVSLQFLPPNTEASKVLHLDTLLDCDRLSHEYSKIGMEIMSLLGRHSSTLTAVEHDMMKSAWLKNYSRGSEAWHLLGSAIRQGQEMGLHLQASIPKVTGEDIGVELEKFCHMSVMLGRPRSINASDCTVKTPIDCTFPDDPSKTIPTVALLQDPQSPPSTYSTQLFQYSLAQKIHELLAAGAHRPHMKDYSFVTNLYNEVVSMVDALPPTLRLENTDKSWDNEEPSLPRQRYATASAAHLFLMVLHRPHAPVHTESRTASIKAALACLHAQEQLFKLIKPHQYRIYTLSFTSIDCGIFLSGIIFGSPNLENGLKGRIHVAIEKAIGRLIMMQESCPMAKSGLRILTICHERILKRDKNDGVVTNKSGVLDQMEGQKVEEGRDNAITKEDGASPQNPYSFEAQQSESTIPPQQFNATTIPGIDFNNFEMDTSFWEEMKQMIDFDVGFSHSTERFSGSIMNENLTSLHAKVASDTFDPYFNEDHNDYSNRQEIKMGTPDTFMKCPTVSIMEKITINLWSPQWIVHETSTECACDLQKTPSAAET